MKWLDKNQNKILIGIWSVIFLTCLFVIFTEPVHAATGTNTEIPFNVSEWSDYNQMMLQRVDIAIQQYKSAVPSNADKPLLIWTLDGFYNDAWFQYYIMPSPYYDSNIIDDFDFSNTPIRFKTDYEIVTVIVGVNGDIGGTMFPHSRRADLLGNSASVNTSQGAYLPRYPFYFDGEPILSTNNIEVLISRVNGGGSGGLGHATQPINDPDNLIDDGHGNELQRPSKPTPTPFTPQPFNPPSIDTSTLESLVESLIDVVEYGFNYIGGVIIGSFSNLLSNLGAWVDYIVQSFSYGFNNVVKAIQNLATDFYNNMVSLFEPFYEFLSGVASFFNHLIEIGTVDGAFNLANIVTYLFLPDSSAIYPIFVSHDEFNIIGITNHLFDEYRLFMSRVESINTLHYIMIPSFTFHGQTIPQTRIDFSWFENYKVYTDGVISAFLIVGYVYYLFTRISGWLRGNQGDVYVGDNSSNYHGTKIGF